MKQIKFIAPRLWGVPAWMLTTWYLAVAQKQILYAAVAWAESLGVHARRHLESAQRIFMLRIARAYRTTSTHALYTLTNLPPITLELEGEVLKAKIRLGHTVNIHGITYDTDAIEHKTRKVTQDPSRINKLICIQGTGALNKTDTPIQIYTDGSKHENVTTNAFCVYHNNQLIYTQAQHLFTYNTVFQAELHAILLAILWAIQKGNKRITIHTDCRSVVSLLSQHFTKNKMARDIHTLINENFHSVYLAWVRGHVGVAGNELADALANSIVSNEIQEQFQLPIPQSHFKRIIKSTILEKWQSLWSNSEKGRYTFQYIPRINEINMTLHPSIVIFITGHGPFPSYLFKIGRRDSDVCTCGDIGDPEHYMFRCPLTRPYHMGTVPSLEHKKKWLENVLNSFILSGKLIAISRILVDHF